MHKNFFRVLLSLVLGFAGVSAGAASFECTAARGKVETMICSDATLSARDEALDAAYAKLHNGASDTDMEKTMQLAWLRLRNTCTDFLCLQRAYDARIDELHAKLASVHQLVGFWEKTFTCDGLSGIYAERCKQGARDRFQLSIVVLGGRICALHAVSANMGNRVDEVEDRQPSMTGTTAGNDATVHFRSTWGGTGTAVLHIEGKALHWKATPGNQEPSYIPDDAVLQRVPAGPSDRMPECHA